MKQIDKKLNIVFYTIYSTKACTIRIVCTCNMYKKNVQVPFLIIAHVA